jgi:hypothetical protein
MKMENHFSWHDVGEDAFALMAILLGATLIAVAIAGVGYAILEVFQEIGQRIYPFDLI